MMKFLEMKKHKELTKIQVGIYKSGSMEETRFYNGEREFYYLETNKDAVVKRLKELEQQYGDRKNFLQKYFID